MMVNREEEWRKTGVHAYLYCSGNFTRQDNSMGSVRKPMYEVRSSPIHGSGVFALRPLRKGTRVLEYIGERISVEEGDRRYGDDDAEHPHVLLFGVDDETVIDGGVNANEGHFINHSCDPNCEAEVVDGRVFISAIRSIREGEELTYDYALDYPYEVDDEARRRYACRCGAADCRGSMLAMEEEAVE
jgi:uncharacterized protein